jgi:hypothetical protein
MVRRLDPLAIFTDRHESERATALLDGLGIEHPLISAEPA